MNFSDFNASTPVDPGQAAETCADACIQSMWAGRASVLALIVTVFLAYLDVVHSDKFSERLQIVLHCMFLLSVANLGVTLFGIGGV